MIAISPSAGALPTYEQVKQQFGSSDALVLDRQGKVLHERRIDKKRRRLQWVALGDVSPALINAVIAAEDKRFREHHGVDWKAMAGVALRSLKLSRPRGASTLSMQLGGFLERGPGTYRRRTVGAKWRQMNVAWELERTWSKDQILEGYLNLVTFRGELQGVGAASRSLFAKEPHGLSGEDALILAALIRDPNAALAEVERRACRLAQELATPVACESIQSLVGRVLGAPAGRIPPRMAWAPHAARELLPSRIPSGTGVLRVSSTLDGELQRVATQTLRTNLLEIKERNVHDGAVLIVDNRTGEVLAYVGSSGDLAQSPEVDGVRAARQAGSSLKPFLYGLAIDRKILTAASTLDDSALDIPVVGGVYRPHNYDNQFRGPVTVRVALASSLNVPAVRALLLVGVSEFVDELAKLGFSDLREAEYYGPSLALGSADVSLWELVGAYRALARGGLYSELSLGEVGPRPAPRRVLSREASFVISQILSDRGARHTTFGLESPLATRYWSAVKTGTSKDMRDNWCVGYSERYTVGVWIGNFSGEPMWNVTGVSGAAPVWIDLMNYLHQHVPSAPPIAPSGLIRQAVRGQDEWFLRRTEPGGSQMDVVAGTEFGHINYPTNGEQMAIDPDIPEGRQQVYFEANRREPLWMWRLDGAPLGSAADSVAWVPRKGRHVIELVDESKSVIDRADFTVKGGG
jgi:penicillin-binding protein 1C